MVGLTKATDVSTFHGEPISAGTFGVTKIGSDMLRVIFDWRPRTAVELPMLEALSQFGCYNAEFSYVSRLRTSPHPSQFCDVVMLPWERFSINFDDASDYYNQWKWPEARRLENALGDPFIAEQLIEWAATARLDELKHLEDPHATSLYWFRQWGISKLRTLLR